MTIHFDKAHPRPTSEEGPTVAAAAPQESNNYNHRNCASQELNDQGESACARRYVNLAAALARRGFELRATATGTYIVLRWSLSRELGDLDAIEAFASRVGAVSTKQFDSPAQSLKHPVLQACTCRVAPSSCVPCNWGISFNRLNRTVKPQAAQAVAGNTREPLPHDRRPS